MITAQSIPDYDEWGSDSYWTCQEWVLWHKALKAAYGKQQADVIFQNAWDNRSAFGHELVCSLYDSEFISYFKSQGYSWDIVSGAIITVSDVAGNIGDAASNLTSLLKWIVPVFVIVIAFILVVNFSKMSAAK